jgi:phosphatidylserine/phosphatidylglycerophosphate/cardiolipin synthase-like enzyme
VHFRRGCPGRCRRADGAARRRIAILPAEIDAAICTIDLSIYILSEPLIIEALGRAEVRGVTVRVMLEEHPFGGGGEQQATRELLESLGIEVRWSGSQIRFSHAKYMVIDGGVAVIMNQNLTTSAFTSNRDFGVITTSPEEVLQAAGVFERDWEHKEINDPPGPLILSPTNSRVRLIEIIDGATGSIDFYAEIMRDSGIVAALERAIDRGVAVRLIVDRSIDEEMRVMLAGLAVHGMDIRISSSPLHPRQADPGRSGVGGRRVPKSDIDLAGPEP